MTAIVSLVQALAVGGLVAVVTRAAGPAVAAALGAGLGALPIARALGHGLARAGLGLTFAAAAAVGLDAIVQHVLGAGHPSLREARPGALYPPAIAGLVLLGAWLEALKASLAGAPSAPSRAPSGSSSGSD